MTILNPFQLLELNVISAQDLAPVSRSMRTYAVAWVHPDRKLSTRVDTHGHNNPTWNDKFVFRVDDEFLHSDTSAVMIEIYALHWFKDIHVGTVRILVGNLIPTPPRLHQFSQQPQVGMRFVALQVRRPSGRPQGILNIGVALLHSSMRSMPLYSQLSTSAIGYRNLMGEEDPFANHHSNTNNQSHGTPTVLTRPEMRRSKSDTSSMIGSELRGSEMMGKGMKSKASSMVNGSEVSKQKKKGRSKASSMISGSVVIKRKGKSRKASSMISGSGIEEGYAVKNGKNGKSNPGIVGKKDKVDQSSILSGSEVYPVEQLSNKKEKPVQKLNSSEESFNSQSWKKPPNEIPNSKVEVVDSPRGKPGQETPNSRFDKMPYATPLRTPQRLAGSGTARATPMHDKFATPRRSTPLNGKSSYTKHNEFTYTTPRKSFLGGAFLTESELGPSPSEVAAQMARQKTEDGNESSIVGGLSLNDSVEGLQSKLERWRTELPPVYDRGELSSFPSSETREHNRRHSDGGGLFSCFSNICGCECSIVCGGSPKATKKSASGRLVRSPSVDQVSFL
ncbi:uncharacterized protein LOC101215059 [Cucumis sativus]|uniref:C2 domain-containing protein n=1 Tax=Cucumis sativus TaxID=3659 RepID=A0A0A0LI48_CUCSA|nr:uncharacterized protein LOC101215059 [Cucumis sativus]KGN61560.1 hypothetical protein Csa_006811 [Cucumis sativus]